MLKQWVEDCRSEHWSNENMKEKIVEAYRLAKIESHLQHHGFLDEETTQDENNDENEEFVDSNSELPHEVEGAEVKTNPGTNQQQQFPSQGGDPLQHQTVQDPFAAFQDQPNTGQGSGGNTGQQQGALSMQWQQGMNPWATGWNGPTNQTNYLPPPMKPQPMNPAPMNPHPINHQAMNPQPATSTLMNHQPMFQGPPLVPHPPRDLPPPVAQQSSSWNQQRSLPPKPVLHLSMRDRNIATYPPQNMDQFAHMYHHLNPNTNAHQYFNTHQNPNQVQHNPNVFQNPNILQHAQQAQHGPIVVPAWPQRQQSNIWMGPIQPTQGTAPERAQSEQTQPKWVGDYPSNDFESPV